MQSFQENYVQYRYVKSEMEFYQDKMPSAQVELRQ